MNLVSGSCFRIYQKSGFYSRALNALFQKFMTAMFTYDLDWKSN